jgi:hypothetical protein
MNERFLLVFTEELVMFFFRFGTWFDLNQIMAARKSNGSSARTISNWFCFGLEFFLIYELDCKIFMDNLIAE